MQPVLPVSIRAYFLLPIFAFNDSAIISFPLSGVTLDWFFLLWETEALHDALYNSVMIAIIAATLAPLWNLCRASGDTLRLSWKKGITGFLLLPIVLPEIIVGVALLVVMVQLGLSLSAWTVVIGHVLICTPFAIVILSSAFKSFDMSLEEASQDLGSVKLGLFFVSYFQWSLQD